MKLISLVIICILSIPAKSELLKPTPFIEPESVVSIQLEALKQNNLPYKNAGIAQTWEFAHPINRLNTGPLKKFEKMMYSNSYSMMLNHQYHNIIKVEKKDNLAFFFIELVDKSDNKFGFQWILQKISIQGDYFNCWMTISVSQPTQLAKST